VLSGAVNRWEDDIERVTGGLGDALEMVGVEEW